jgi:hypothetical protein
MKWRGLITERRQSTVMWHGYAIYVAGARALPQNLPVGPMLDKIARDNPGKRPALVRTVARTADQAVIHLRMEDALPLLHAVEEQEIRR